MKRLNWIVILVSLCAASVAGAQQTADTDAEIGTTPAMPADTTEGATGTTPALPADAPGPMANASFAWNEAMTACPDPAVGSAASAWAWRPDADERALYALDLNGPGTTFDFLADFEGTSIIIRVRDAETNESLAVIKTNSSNTEVDGEVFAYRLSRFLAFDGLVAPAVPVDLGGGALEKLLDLISHHSYDDPNKERNRDRVERQVRQALRDGTTFHGAMKPWLGAFMFHSGLGHRESLAEQPVMRRLRARSDQPNDELVTLEQFTRLYSPAGTHRGVIPMWQLAMDMSNMMLMDALTGQNDRFAGANIHFIAVEGERTEEGERRSLPIYNLGEVRLLALDNGATLSSSNGSGLADIQGNIVRGTRVERFSEAAVQRVLAMGRRALGAGCDSAPFADEHDAMWSYFGLSGRVTERTDNYLGNTIEYVQGIVDRYGDAAFLRPVHGDSDEAIGD